MSLAQTESRLTDIARRLLAGCRFPAADGTVLYLPDGQAHYHALWTRDFAYMVEYAGDLMPSAHIEACIRYLLAGQRADGAIPDRVRPDGVPIYAAGPDDHPVGLPNLDNGPFLVIAADTYLASLDAERGAALFAEWAPRLARGLDYVPLSPGGLVYNDPAAPHSPYGFTDTVGKTGELFMESALYWNACRRLAARYAQSGNAARAADFAGRAATIEKAIDRLWDEGTGVFMAATRDCRQTDIWGNAYAAYAGLLAGERRARVLTFLHDRHEDYLDEGQVRHLLRGEHWARLLTPVPPGTYQNGAYWATATGWIAWCLAQLDPALAERTLAGLVAYFDRSGVYECVNGDYRQLDSYVASATNPLGGARRLLSTHTAAPLS